MPPFYAYAKLVGNDPNWRYVIVFSTRAVADEWWRLISTTTDTNVAGSIKRITPQFYTYDWRGGKIKITETIMENRVASQFVTKMFFVLQNDRDSHDAFQIIPPAPRDFADHLSGNWFYIRTPGSNPAYWYYLSSDRDTTGVIVASREHSTRFRITAVDDGIKDGTVMINSDLVRLSFWGGKVKSMDNGSLQSADTAEQFKFGSLFGGSSGFRINAYGKRMVGGLWRSAIIKTDKADHDNDAQEWELSLVGAVGGEYYG